MGGQMTAIEETKIKEVVSNMDTEQMQMAIQAFPIEIVFNELERREQEHIDLLNRLDELSAFVGSVTR